MKKSLAWSVAYTSVFTLLFNAFSIAQNHTGENPAAEAADLQFVIYLTRHGVRSPTGKAAQYNKYSAAAWPEWNVPPGYLTSHGYKLMSIFGAYDRAKLAADGLLSPRGCEDATHISILADSDQRTRETGKALAEGMFPGCAVALQASNEGTVDPLFHFLEAAPVSIDQGLATAAVAGRIGGDINNLTSAYRPQLSQLEHVLAGCDTSSPPTSRRTSLFDVPATLEPGSHGQPVELRGPLAVASTLSENLLLEYTEGMPPSQTGWGCIDGRSLRDLMQLHTAAADLSQRTPAIARIYASNLIDAILSALEQRAIGKPIPGSPARPDDRVLILVGHDTNIATVAGALRLDWIIDGRRNDTPPGGALVFELWRSRVDHQPFVRLRYTAQTLEQMREATLLTAAHPPADVPVFLPGCSRADMSCSWPEFLRIVKDAIDISYVDRNRRYQDHK